MEFQLYVGWGFAYYDLIITSAILRSIVFLILFTFSLVEEVCWHVDICVGNWYSLRFNYKRDLGVASMLSHFGLISNLLDNSVKAIDKPSVFNLRAWHVCDPILYVAQPAAFNHHQVDDQDPSAIKLFHYSIVVEVLALVVVFAYSKSGKLPLHIANNIVKPVYHFITFTYLFHPFTTTWLT